MKLLVILATGYWLLTQAVGAQTLKSELRDEPPEMQEWDKVSASLKRMSMAYRLAATQRMLAEANEIVMRLHLPISHPIQPADCLEMRIAPPWYCRLDSPNTNLSKLDRVRAAQIPAAGGIKTANMQFTFRQGILAYLSRQSQEGYEYHPKPDLPLVINEAQAYQLATQNLAAISVDISALQQHLKSKVWRQRYGKFVQPKEEVASFYTAQWGDETYPAVRVTIDGTTKELLAIDIQDASYSLRSRLIITNAMDLLNKSDPPKVRLQRFSQSQTNPAQSRLPRN